MNAHSDVGGIDENLNDLKNTIHQTYPKGWFVGVAAGQVVAAAAGFRELEALLRAKGHDPRTVLVIQAGVAVPDYVTIFA